MAQSIVDYIFRRLALDYLPFETRAALGIYTADERARQLETGSYAPVEEVTEEDLESLSQSARGVVSDDDRVAACTFVLRQQLVQRRMHCTGGEQLDLRGQCAGRHQQNDGQDNTKGTRQRRAISVQ